MVFKVVSFGNCARDRASGIETGYDPRLLVNTGVLHIIPSKTLEIVDEFGLLHVLRNTTLYYVYYLLSWPRSRQYDWPASYISHPLMPYLLEEVQVDPFYGSNNRLSKRRRGERCTAVV